MCLLTSISSVTCATHLARQDGAPACLILVASFSGLEPNGSMKQLGIHRSYKMTLTWSEVTTQTLPLKCLTSSGFILLICEME